MKKNLFVGENQGFTIIEIMVTVAILVIVMSVILVQSRSSRSDFSITSDAYEIALLFREAQSYGIAVREDDTGSFDSGYGIMIHESDMTRVDLFTDTNKNGHYDSGETLVKSLRLKDGNVISDFCGRIASPPSVTCNSTGLDEISLGFARPNPEINIYCGVSSYETAEIDLLSPNGDAAQVVVYSTGQIEVVENP